MSVNKIYFFLIFLIFSINCQSDAYDTVCHGRVNQADRDYRKFLDNQVFFIIFIRLQIFIVNVVEHLKKFMKVQVKHKVLLEPNVEDLVILLLLIVGQFIHLIIN